MRVPILWLAVRRVLTLIPLLLGIVTIAFVATRVVPRDPAYAIAGEFATPAQIHVIRHKLGTDRPLFTQYTDYLRDAATFNFGRSVFTGNRVSSELLQRLPSTLELIVLSLLLGSILGVTAGALAARHRDAVPDRLVRGTSFFLLSLPEFWLGLILIYLFAFRIRLAPIPTGQLGLGTIAPPHRTGAALLDSVLSGRASALHDAAAHVVLPVVTLGVLAAAPIARLTRSAAIGVLESDHMRFARTCGLSEKQLRRYTLRGAAPAIVTLIGVLFASLFGGTVLIETIFAWGGVSQFAAESILRGDFPVVQAYVLLAGALVVAVFFVVDLMYLVVDPRVRI